LKKIFEIFNANGPKIPIVVHGGTGLQPDVVKKLISLGGSKFNISTDLKHTLIDAIYEYISSHRDEYNPGKIDITAKNATINKVESWIELLGSAGKA
jgi:fructose-bisphosphate aldolase class II